MSAIIATGGLVSLNLPPSVQSHHRRSSPSTSTFPHNSTTPSFPTINCSLPSNSNSSSQNPNSSNSNPSSQNPNSSKFHPPSLPVNTPILFAALTLGFGFLLYQFTGFGGGIFGGRGGGGGSGGSHSGGGKFWSKFFSLNAKEEEEEESESWDPHGLSTNVKLKLDTLDETKKYKVSEIVLFDMKVNDSTDSDEVKEFVTLIPGGVYSKAQLKEELEKLSTYEVFEKVEFEGKTKLDGTIGIKLSFKEFYWESPDRFKCINAGLLENEFTGDEEEDYKRKIDRAKPCLLPPSVHKEVRNMLGEEWWINMRLLKKIRNKVEKWYHDNGYICAQVVNFGNLNTREMVCEVAEGEITEVVLQFQDEHGNVRKGNERNLFNTLENLLNRQNITRFEVVKKELLLDHLQQGKFFNLEEAKQALNKISSLGLFSSIEFIPRPDNQRVGGIVVDVILQK